MGIRKVHFCDWCEAESKIPECVGNGWQRIEHDLWICEVCSQHRKDAINKVRVEREACRPARSGSQADR